ncbi:MAG TPA: adenylate/guanylate cyclase domain-containing protein [Solirubrobacteraceae bacterium]|nr:adenylate/guanylate cyclase domain-containing protein [Solirubrobacteraceae bacterium]
MQVHPDSGTLAPYVPRALLARLARASIEVLTETVPVTMVFADVSGFTRLSERLARAGQEGAEQLVDLINACFTDLLADAYRRGGSLVKFGGDAMLLLFYNEGHTQRACDAAAAMRRTLRRVGHVRAGESNVVLRMTVGVHSGEYTMFVVGDSHRELLIGGSAATAVVEMESTASSGHIVISPQTARCLPRSCVGANIGPGFLLARCPPAPEWASPPGLVTPTDEVIAAFLPDAVRTQLLEGSGSIAPQHRTAAVAFVRFGGLDELIAQRGASTAAQRLDELVRLVQEAADRYEVCFLDTDIATNGGKIRLSAGVPWAIGEDEERLLLALRHIIEAQPPFPVQAGMSWGPVFTAAVGPPYRRWYAVMGDTVNVAARLAAQAPAGRVYATGDFLRNSKASFQMTVLEPFHVKGRDQPVHAADVGARGLSDPGATHGPRLPLVGRDRDLERLRLAIDGARRGRGALIELVGEPGSGKSRLLAEARALADGLTVLRTACEVYSRQTPYAVWRDLLHQLLGVERDDPVIAQVFESKAAELHEAVVRLLGSALVVPTLVEIEHVELMDAASVGLFDAVASDLQSSAWVIVVTRSDVAGGLRLEGHDHLRIELEALSREDTLTLALTTNEAAQLPPHVLNLAADRSGGSPSFLLDLLAAAAGGHPDELPEGVGAATMARIDALDPRDGVIVRRAAVLGLTFKPRRLLDVLDRDTAPADEGFWNRLSTVFVREPDGQVRFRHPAVQEAAYASLPFKLRRQLHMAVGLRLERDLGVESDADPAVLSQHFALAGDHARAYRYAMGAARQATERFSHADAAQLYRRAIDAGRASGLADDSRALGEAWEQLGEALRCMGEPEAAAQALTEARRLLSDDPVAQARICHSHAKVAERSTSLTAAVRWLQRGLRCVDGLAGAEALACRAQIRSHLGGIRNRQGRWAEAISTSRQAIAEAEAAGELSALTHAYCALDWALIESGRPEEATNSLRALELCEQLGDPEHESAVLNSLGLFAYFDGRWDEAVALYERAGECSDRAGRPADRALADCNVGEILSDRGRLDEAEAHLQRARRVWSATGERQAVAFVDVLLTRLAVRRGSCPDGVRTLEEAASELRKFGADVFAAFARALVAEAHAFTGDAPRALEIARRELETSRRHRPLLERVSGVALARLGRVDEAEQQLRISLAGAREGGADYEVAATIDVLDSLGVAGQDMLRDRDEIVERLQIERLPVPALAFR